MVRKAIYYDGKINISSFLDDRIYKAKPEDYTLLDYDSISSWLDNSKPGDILVFGQDVIPYTAYDITPVSSESKLLKFLNNGGIVVWIGDAPFYYRVRCYDTKYRDAILDTLEIFKKRVVFTPVPDVYIQKFGPYERDDKVCIMDIIGGFHIDLEKVSWISLDYEHLNFLKQSEVCFMGSPVYTTQTLIGKLLGYDGTVTVRPTKLTTKIFPLTIVKMHGICSGKYAGSWIANVGSGYFVRLYDVVDEVNVIKTFSIAEQLSRLF